MRIQHERYTKPSGRAMGREGQSPHPFLTTVATSDTYIFSNPFQYSPPFVEHSGSVEGSLASYLTCRNCPTEVKTHSTMRQCIHRPRTQAGRQASSSHTIQGEKAPGAVTAHLWQSLTPNQCLTGLLAPTASSHTGTETKSG